MKTIIMVFGMLVAIATPAQNTNPANNAEMTFEKDTYDYGIIKQGSDGNCEFVFTNTGTAPLIISDAQGSCGCTIPDWPKKPIMPGQKAVIKVHYNTSRPGPINKFVTLFANVEGGSQKIYIKGTVEAPVQTGNPEKKENAAFPLEK
jgi:hypothetical protein